MIPTIRRHWPLWTVCMVASGVICAADCVVPLGFVICFAYVAVVVGTAPARNRTFTLVIAAETTLLTLVGAVFSPVGADPPLVAVNRGISILVSWTIAWLLLRTLRADDVRLAAVAAREAALNELKILQGLLPICSRCKKIRDESGRWEHLEAYISKHSQASFTHGICKECARELYGDLLDEGAGAVD